MPDKFKRNVTEIKDTEKKERKAWGSEATKRFFRDLSLLLVIGSNESETIYCYKLCC